MSATQLTQSHNVPLCFSIPLEDALEKIAKSVSGPKNTWDASARLVLGKYLHVLLLTLILQEKDVFSLKTQHEDTIKSTLNTLELLKKEQLSIHNVFHESNTDTTESSFNLKNFFNQILSSTISSGLQLHAKSEVFKATITKDRKPLYLNIDATEIQKFIEEYFDFHQKVFEDESSLTTVCVGFAACLEYVAAELSELSGINAIDNNVNLESVKSAISSDDELLSLPYTIIFFQQ
ncbi:hypothetical protein ABK040_005692 [Willaertia magna]